MVEIKRGVKWLVLSLQAIAAPVAAQQTIPLPARDVALKEVPATVFTVGVEEGREFEMFAGIRGVAFDRADNLYVLDGQNTRVVVFDARGRYVRHFGKKGGGPGELQAPLSLTIDRDGNVVVNDIANRAFVVFKPTGEHVRNVAFPDDMGMPIGGLYADPNGGLIMRTGMRFRRDAAPDPANNFSTIVRLPLQERASATTLFKVPMPPPIQREGPASGGGRAVSMIRMDPIFGPAALFAALPNGGVAVQSESNYSVRIVDAKGAVVSTLTRAYPVRKVTKKDQEAWLERQRNGENMGGQTIAISTGPGGTTTSIGSGGQPPAGVGPGVRGGMQMYIDEMPFADVMSVVTELSADPQGRLWIQRRHQNGTSDGPIDIVATNGRYIGTLAPQPLPDAVSASGLAAYRVTDDLGVERVTVKRLPAAWR